MSSRELLISDSIIYIQLITRIEKKLKNFYSNNLNNKNNKL